MKLPVLALCTGVCFFAVGCAHQSGIAVGMFDASLESLPVLAAAQFDLVIPSVSVINQREFLGEAEKHGLRAIARPALKNPRDSLRPLDQQAALSAWYLSDEPDLHRVSPAAVKDELRKLRKVTGKPALVVLGSGAAIERYHDTADQFGVDWYPIPWTPLATISREMRSARLASDGKPFFAVLQAFDWNVFPKMLHGEWQLREPTYEEIRCMTFLSLFHGASGIIFYSYEAGKWKLAEHPALWAAVTNVAGEVKQRAPIFEGRIAWVPIEMEYFGPHSQMYNEIQEASIALNMFRVKNGTESCPGGFYFLAINSSAKPVSFKFRFPFVDSFPASACAGAVIENGWLKKEYAPFEVCFFGPFSQSANTSPL